VEKLYEWADAVRTAAMKNWRTSQAKRPIGDMDGYPGIKQAIQEAKEHLVFLHDDRAPHGLFLVCKRWYQKEMASHLSNSDVFVDVEEPWEDIHKHLKEVLKDFGFQAGTGIPYNYGIWKPKKQKSRYIAGTRAPPHDPDTTSEANNKPKGPPRSPTYFLSRFLVKALDHVSNSLQAKDEIRQQESGLCCYWPIKGVNQFTRLARVHASHIQQHGMATFDFTTMYTAFDQDVIAKNVMEAYEEAQQYEASRCPQGSDLPNMTEGGWVFGEGFSREKIEAMLRFTLATAYTVNGGKVRRQIKGMPMGIPHAPQMANLACYPIEKAYTLAHRPTGLIRRFIDEFFTSGMLPPPQELYGMAYQLTSSSNQDVVYLEVRCWIDKGRLRTTYPE